MERGVLQINSINSKQVACY